MAAKRYRPATKGQTVALKHGAGSEVVLGPSREQHLASIQVDYPGLDKRSQWALADRWARIERAAAFLDEFDLFKNKGNPWPIVDRMERWLRQAERILADAEAKKSGQTVRFDLATAMSAITTAQGEGREND